MTHATEPDLGPLTWVKGEIDAALGRAREILERGCAGSEAAGLQFAQSHLHQVRGALDIVGLDGLTLFTDTLEQLLGANVTQVTVQQIDLVNDTTLVDVRYQASVRTPTPGLRTPARAAQPELSR